MRLSPAVRKRVNSKLHALGLKYWDKIPNKDIEDILAEEGLVYLDEELKPFDGFLVGANSEASFYVGDKGKDGEVYKNVMLHLSWYKREETGRYEIVAYLG